MVVVCRLTVMTRLRRIIIATIPPFPMGQTGFLRAIMIAVTTRVRPKTLLPLDSMSAFWIWRRFALSLLHSMRVALALSTVSAPHVMHAARQGITQVRMGGQTISRRAAAALGGISRKTKEELRKLCEDRGIAVTDGQTRQELLDALYAWAPPGDFEAGGSRRRTRDPNMPGLARLRREQLLQLAQDYDLEVPENATVAEIRKLLYDAPPVFGRPAPQARSWAQSSTASSSTTPAPKVMPHSQNRTRVPTLVSPRAKSSARSSGTAPGLQPEEYNIAEAEDLDFEFPEEGTEQEEADTSQAIQESVERMLSVMTPEERLQMLQALRTGDA